MTDGLLVDRKELQEGLTTIRRFSKAKGTLLAYVYLELGQLKIQAGKTRVTVSCRGEWPTPIAVNAVMLGRASLNLPKSDPILMQAVLDRMYIDTLSLDCHKVRNVPSFTNPPSRKAKPKAAVEKTEASRSSTDPLPKMRDGLTFPQNASSKHLLKARLQYTEDEITYAGLSGRIEKALLERNRRITKALEQLSAYGISHSDLVKLVESCLLREEEPATK